MALKATIFKVDLSISDLNRHYYAQHSLTLARHPSENNERMMLRLLAFIDNADEQLEFTRGLSDTDAPDLWFKNDFGEINQWIELGQPSSQRIKKGCNQSQEMLIYNYHNNSFEQWWQKEQNQLSERKNLKIKTIEEHLAEALAALVERQMTISATLDGNELFLTIGDEQINTSFNQIS